MGQESSAMTTVESTKSEIVTRLEHLEAREAILRIVHEHSHGFDKRDMDRLLAVWHPEGTWLVAPEYEATGHDGIRAIAEQSWAQMATTHHWNCNEVIDIDGDRATGLVDVIALAQTHAGSWHQSPATYHDTYVRWNGRWVLQRREAKIHATINLAIADAGHPWGDIASQ
jgi:hypothetical protein